MGLVGRNDACPCGSGRKYKRCCIGREAELRRRRDLTEELFALGALFPVLRPLQAEPEEWACRAELDRSSVEAGLSLLSDDERARILRCAAEHCGEAWTTAAAEYGDDAESEQLLLVGALAASVGECRDPHAELLAELEREGRTGDPVEVLAEVLACAELWSLPETVAAAVGVDPACVLRPQGVGSELGRVARDLWTPDHEQRLRFLVERVAARAPKPGLDRTSAAVTAACSAVQHDRDAQLSLAAALLEDALPGAAAFLAAAA